jgi:nucleotide-binding universal stress UspA family protein
MTKPILVGFDPDHGDRSPLEFGVAAARFTGGHLIVAAVYASGTALGNYGEGLVEDQLGDDASVQLDHIGKELRAQGIDVEVRSLPGTSAPRALHHAAEEFDAGLLVLGSTRRGRAGRLLPGSTSDRLMHGAPCALAVVPCEWKAGGGVSTIGVAFVDTEEGREALTGAAALARRAGARLRVLTAAKLHGTSQTYGGGDVMHHATTYGEVASTDRVAMEKLVADRLAEYSDIEIEPDVSVGDPADFLIAASANVDLLVCGSRGYGPRRAVLLGGVSRRITAEASCPVIVLARGSETGLEAVIGEQATAIG